MISSQDARLTYLNARAKFESMGINPEQNDITLSQGYLQFESVLNQTNTQYDFPIVDTDTSTSTSPRSLTEKRLKLQDIFFVSHMLFCIRISQIADQGNVTDYRNIYLRFPSAWFFGHPVVEGTDLQIMSIWNGWLSLAVNNDILIPQWDTQRHLYVPQTQYPNWQGAAPVSEFYNPFDQVDGGQDGFYPVEPNVILWGSANNSLKLNLPWPIGWQSETNTIRAVVMVRGVLAQNCTSVAVRDIKASAKNSIVTTNI